MVKKSNVDTIKEKSDKRNSVFPSKRNLKQLL